MIPALLVPHSANSAHINFQRAFNAACVIEVTSVVLESPNALSVLAHVRHVMVIVKHVSLVSMDSSLAILLVCLVRLSVWIAMGNRIAPSVSILSSLLCIKVFAIRILNFLINLFRL